MNHNAFKHILIIQTAFIGDAILASSLAEKLHSRFPAAELSILVRKGNEPLYEGHPFLKVMVWNKKEHKLKHLFALLRQIRKQKFDLVVNCHRHASSGFLAGFSKGGFITGYKQNPLSFLFHHAVKHRIGDGSHEVGRYNQLIESITDGEVFRPRLYPSAEQFENVRHLKNRPYVCMAPSSVWFTKQLPEYKWVELANKIPADHAIYLLGAPQDLALCGRIKKESNHEHMVVLAGNLSLLESCALMKDARMNYVNDSAPLHLSSAMNAPVTAFFCSTVPEFGFTPLSDHSSIVEIGYALECRPCGLHGYKQCPRGHFKCAHDIRISDVA